MWIAFNLPGLRYRESKLAHKLLDGLQGIEIGPSTHNPYGLQTLNVDYSDEMSNVFQAQSKNKTGVVIIKIVNPLYGQ